MGIENLSAADAVKKVSEAIECTQWRKIFLQNLNTEKGTPQWDCNMKALYKDVTRYVPNTSFWGPSYGLWPGQTWARFAAQSKWVYLNSNTLQFYNVFPRLQGTFPGSINIHADGFDSPLNHWLHEHPANQVYSLSQSMYRWLRW